MKTDFEAMGGSYHWEGDYLIPDVAVPEMPNIGIWGQRRKQYLMDNRKPLYTAMLLSGNCFTAVVDFCVPVSHPRCCPLYRKPTTKKGMHRHIAKCIPFILLCCFHQCFPNFYHCVGIQFAILK